MDFCPQREYSRREFEGARDLRSAPSYSLFARQASLRMARIPSRFLLLTGVVRTFLSCLSIDKISIQH